MPAPVIETLPASMVTSTSAVLNGQLISSDASPNQGVHFHWGEEGDLSNTTDDQNLANGQFIQETLTELSISTKYCFYVCARSHG